MTKGSRRSGGYTIVETLIFLAVTGSMFISAMVITGGQQRKTEFSQGVRDFAATLQTYATDVSNGYASFPFGSGSCWTNGTTVVVAASAPGSQRCIFIGRVLQFAPGGDNTKYQVYSVVGTQYQLTSPAKESESIATAAPIALGPGSGADYSKQVSLGGGLTVGWVRHSGLGSNIGSMGFFTTFAAYPGGNLASNSLNVNTVPVVSSTLTDTTTALVTKVHNPSNLALSNPQVTICLNSAGTNQSAQFTFGGTGNGAGTVNTRIMTGVC